MTTAFLGFNGVITIIERVISDSKYNGSINDGIQVERLERPKVIIVTFSSNSEGSCWVFNIPRSMIPLMDHNWSNDCLSVTITNEQSPLGFSKPNEKNQSEKFNLDIKFRCTKFSPMKHTLIFSNGEFKF